MVSQAALVLDNKLLQDGQQDLLEGFIKLIANSIDAKSPYTGGHCARVPIISEMMAEALCAAKTGPFSGFDLDDEAWYELRVAAWLHDCGKITTPVHVMDKATRLETIYDRFETIATRQELLKRMPTPEALQRAGGGTLSRNRTEPTSGPLGPKSGPRFPQVLQRNRQQHQTGTTNRTARAHPMANQRTANRTARGKGAGADRG